MSTLKNLVRKGFYADSVALMRVAREVSGSAGVVEASLMIGTPSNKALLADSGLLAPEGKAARPEDLIIAVKARSPANAQARPAAIKRRRLSREVILRRRRARGARFRHQSGQADHNEATPAARSLRW